MNWRERVYAGSLTSAAEGRNVLLMGWVDAIRNHGNLLFIHLRDKSGIIQVVFNPVKNKESFEKALLLREEFVVAVSGIVAFREKGAENKNLSTGDIEVFATKMDIFSSSRNLPFKISEKAIVFGEDIKLNPEHVDEDLRLTYRYLDIRRPSIQDLFIKRSRIIKEIRDYFYALGFIEFETPFLTKSTPEGARDFLVPSRLHHGKFYALPQSPQLFKQLLMIGGMERYFQIVKCFRDEDLRPNRQPEFTQLDMEASFIDEEFICELIEELIVRLFAIGEISLSRPFKRMTYADAMDLYGTDCPDLRFGMAFRDATDLLTDTGYSIFRNIIRQGGKVKGFCVRKMADDLSKNVLQNEYAMKIVPSLGAKGMTWMKVIDGKLQSNIVQFFNSIELSGIIELFDAKEGDVIMMIADLSPALVNKVLGLLRLHVAERFGLIPEDRYSSLWVTDFPLFELKDGRISSQHHPFTMPDRTEFDPDNVDGLLKLKSKAYDLIINGEELGGGSIRIHDMDIQKKVFQALGLSREAANAKFGFFLNALEYGTPPHGGLALGIDRVISMILKVSSIREVIAFPKNRSAVCPLTRAPSSVEEPQLKEIGITTLAGLSSVDDEMLARQKEGVSGTRTAIKITRDDVRHVAKLARLGVDESEIDEYAKGLNSIINYVELVKELDTKEVRPTSHALESKNVWHDDEPEKESLSEDILSNAPEREGNYFKVPKILEG